MVKILGHRGARGLWPENSIFGFRNAIGLGVDIIEFDVHLSADGRPVVIHDGTLERTTTGQGLVSSKTVAELAECRLLGREEESVTTLDNVLAALTGTSVTLGIEIKTGPDAAPYPNLEAIVIEVLERHGDLGRAMIVSFVPECLERVRARAPGLPVMACVWRPQVEILGGLAAAVARFDRIEGSILAVQEELLSRNEELCRRLIPAERLAVGVHNEPERMQHWLSQPIRHISTDRPDLALEIRSRL
jgi:glycerophosphoryl diester phosphodiesterase